jgi:hypothetical protein
MPLLDRPKCVHRRTTERSRYFPRIQGLALTRRETLFEALSLATTFALLLGAFAVFLHWLPFIFTVSVWEG